MLTLKSCSAKRQAHRSRFYAERRTTGTDLKQASYIRKGCGKPAAADLKVSEDTVRRDLLDLDQKGLLKRVFGGAIPLERPVIGFFDREEADVELKQKLAERALGFLEPDQLVAIDGSSTNLQFAKNIPSDMKLTILTNSYSIAHVCSMKEQVKVIVLGGDLLKDSMTTVGETAAAQAAAYHPDLCFMGVYAVHPEYGMTIPYPEEVSIKSQLIRSSRRVIALVDPVKLNTVSRYHVCGIEAFTALLQTDLWKARWLWDTGTGDWILYKNGLQSLSLLFLRLFALVFL